MSNAMLPWIINIAFRIQEYYQDSSKDTCFETIHAQCLCIFPLNLELTTHKINPGFCVQKEKKQKTNLFHMSSKRTGNPATFMGHVCLMYISPIYYI